MIEKHTLTIVKKLLGDPNPKLSNEKNIRFGNFGSLTIDIEKGTYFDFEENKGGGLVDLIKREGKDPKKFLDEIGVNETQKTELEKVYYYKDSNNVEKYQVCRFYPKTFRPRTKINGGYKIGLHNVDPLPYNLPEITKRQNEVIYIVEGEKDADNLFKLGLLSTTNSGGSNNWKKCLNIYFENRDVIIIPDCDDAGKKHLNTVYDNLKSIVKSFNVIYLKKHKDISDYLKEHTKEDFLELKPEPYQKKELFKTWVKINEIEIEPRDFLYSNHYIRKYLSLTASQGGLGKSSIILTECIAMALGIDILGTTPKKQYKVVYFNSEDPESEIKRRVLAICNHYNINQDDLVGQLFISSGRDHDIIFAVDDGKINNDIFEQLKEFGLKNEIDCFVFDPLANMTSGMLETNENFKEVSKQLSLLADQTNTSIEIVHHTRKLNNTVADVDSIRGGSSLIASVRSARVLNPMSKEEALKAGLPSHLNHFRVDDAKNNLAQSIEKIRWFERVSIQLSNEDFVAVIQPYQLPDAFDGITNEQARRVQIRCNEEQPSLHFSSKKYVGKVIAEETKMDFTNKHHKSKISQILKTWLENDVLEVEETHDTRSGRTVKIVVSGSQIMSSS